MNSQNPISSFDRARLWRGVYWGFAATILVVPAPAMQFAAEVDWTSDDFILAAALIGLTGLVLELALRTNTSFAYRIGAALGLGAAFLLI